jgi:hypothetical protein
LLSTNNIWAEMRIVSKRRLSIVRPTLRTAFLALTVFACSAAYVGYLWRHVRARQLARERIEACGGHVIFEYEGLRGMPGSDPPGPRWVAAILGDRNAFAQVESITFYCNRAHPTEAEMKAVATLKEVRILHLEASSIREADLCYLAQLHSLAELSLTGVDVTPASAKYLLPLRRLNRVNVSRTLSAEVEGIIVGVIPKGCSITKGSPCHPAMTKRRD